MTLFEDVLRSLLDDGLIVRFRVSGISMAPAIRDGDEVLVERVPSFHRRDVVLFRDPRSQRLIAHRVMSMRGSTLVTRGDAAESPEAPIELADVLGRVVGVVREGREVPLRSAGLRIHLLARRLRMAVGKRW